MTTFLRALLVIIFLSFCDGGMLRMSTPAAQRRSRAESTNITLPCDDLVTVDKSSLFWPGPGAPPWENDTSLVFRSSSFSTNFFVDVLAQNVPGLEPGVTFMVTFRAFQDAGCLLYTHGGAVRDFLLGYAPTDIDIEFSCSAESLHATCVELYGNTSCYLRRDYVRVGSAHEMEELEGVNWNGGMFAPPFTKEFTANAVTYDLNGNDVLIDVLGKGVFDVCRKIVRIPVDMSNWDQWVNDNVFFRNNGPMKLARFFKLRAYPKHFAPADADTLAFVTLKMQELWDPNVSSAMSYLYCGFVKGSRSQDGSCYSDEAASEGMAQKIDSYNNAVIVDMGSQWFNKFIGGTMMNTFHYKEGPFITASGTLAFSVPQGHQCFTTPLPNVGGITWDWRANWQSEDATQYAMLRCSVMVAPAGVMDVQQLQTLQNGVLTFACGDLCGPNPPYAVNVFIQSESGRQTGAVQWKAHAFPPLAPALGLRMT